jgi:Tfp pilus assembly protein PilW
MRTRGASLLEISVSIGIASMVFAIVGAIFIAQGRYFAIEDAIAQTQYNAFQVIDTAGLYVLSASSVLGSRTINGTDYTTGTSTLVVRLPSLDASGAILASTYDYIAIGVSATDPTRFVVDIDADANSVRRDATRLPAALVDKLIFRYNAVDPTAATAIELYVRTRKDARGQVILTPLGKTYYLGST